MKETHEQPFTGVWIPYEVVEAQLTWTERGLWSMIHNLSRKDNPCWASNDYLAYRMGTSSNAVAVMLSKLRKMGFIKNVSFNGRTRQMLAVVPGCDTIEGCPPAKGRVVHSSRQSCATDNADDPSIKGYNKDDRKDDKVQIAIAPALQRSSKKPKEELELGVKKSRKRKLNGQQIAAADELIDYLSQKTGTEYAKDHSYQVDIARCLGKTGVTLDECKAMIDREVERCLGQPTEERLTPKGLFGYNTFQVNYDRRNQPVNRNFKSNKDIQREREIQLHSQTDPDLGW